VTDPSAGFDVGQYLDQSSRVRAVVDYFGPSDLMSSDFSSTQHQQILTVFGSEDALRTASPVSYITGDDPPFLIVQGELDTTVPPHQSQELYERLTEGGVPATLVMVENAGHSFNPMGGPIHPSRLEITKMMADFFDAQLKGNEIVGTQSTTVAGTSELPTAVFAVQLAVVAIGITAITVFLLKRK
jgi:dipeptidyl aminopeptidase/acylaminoacyl peptidase